MPTEEADTGSDEARSAALAQRVVEDPFELERLTPELYCGDRGRERIAARACVSLSEEHPELLQPALGRLLRVANATEDPVMRDALARILPRLELGSGGAGRLAFVFESWLEDAAPELQRTAMEAMIALVPQRPALARRIRTVIERRAALGSPTAARHGRALLATLREF